MGAAGLGSRIALKAKKLRYLFSTNYLWALKQGSGAAISPNKVLLAAVETADKLSSYDRSCQQPYRALRDRLKLRRGRHGRGLPRLGLSPGARSSHQGRQSVRQRS